MSQESVSDNGKDELRLVTTPSSALTAKTINVKLACKALIYIDNPMIEEIFPSSHNLLHTSTVH